MRCEGCGAGACGEDAPPVWGKDAKWWMRSQRLGEMRNMAGARGGRWGQERRSGGGSGRRGAAGERQGTVRAGRRGTSASIPTRAGWSRRGVRTTSRGGAQALRRYPALSLAFTCPPAFPNHAPRLRRGATALVVRHVRHAHESDCARPPMPLAAHPADRPP